APQSVAELSRRAGGAAHWPPCIVPAPHHVFPPRPGRKHTPSQLPRHPAPSRRNLSRLASVPSCRLTSMRTALRIAGILVLVLLAGETLAGEWIGSGILHPARSALTPELVAQADQAFTRAGAMREDFVVTAHDGVRLRGWKVRPAHANGDWVLLFHGVSDNRVGMLGQA